MIITIGLTGSLGDEPPEHHVRRFKIKSGFTARVFRFTQAMSNKSRSKNSIERAKIENMLCAIPGVASCRFFRANCLDVCYEQSCEFNILDITVARKLAELLGIEDYQIENNVLRDYSFWYA